MPKKPGKPKKLAKRVGAKPSASASKPAKRVAVKPSASAPVPATRVGVKPSASAPTVLRGRLQRRANGIIQIELTDGLTVDLSEDDCDGITETTDPASQRAMVAVQLKGAKPITAVFQPHFYRVLANSSSLPFVFRDTAGLHPREFMSALVAAQPVGVGGGGGSYDHDTAMMSTTWYGTERDGTKPDSAGEPGTIYLP